MSAYLIATGKVRSFPRGAFATGFAIVKKRTDENTTLIAFSYSFLVPFLQRVNQGLESFIQNEKDVTQNDIADVVAAALRESSIQFADAMSRVAVQTAVATLLYSQRQHKVWGARLDATVFSWDLYPRLHQKYFGDALERLRLPRFISSLLGPKPSDSDVSLFQTKITSAAALEDNIKANVIAYIGHVVVDTGRILIEGKPLAQDPTNVAVKKPRTKKQLIVAQFVRRTCTLLACALLAGTGRSLKADVGEYWGDMIGSVLGPIVATQVIAKLQL